MGRTASRIFLITALATLFARVATAQASEPDFTLNGCGFAIDVRILSSNPVEHVQTLPDGTTITKSTGRLVLSFTNPGTGSTIVRNVSGPSTVTVHPDGTGTFEGQGLSWFGFGPVSQANTGEPGLVFTRGLVILEFEGSFVTSFSLDGTQENGCALLAG